MVICTNPHLPRWHCKRASTYPASRGNQRGSRMMAWPKRRWWEQRRSTCSRRPIDGLRLRCRDLMSPWRKSHKFSSVSMGQGQFGVQAIFWNLEKPIKLKLEKNSIKKKLKRFSLQKKGAGRLDPLPLPSPAVTAYSNHPPATRRMSLGLFTLNTLRTYFRGTSFYCQRASFSLHCSKIITVC